MEINSALDVLYKTVRETIFDYKVFQAWGRPTRLGMECEWNVLEAQVDALDPVQITSRFTSTHLHFWSLILCGITLSTESSSVHVEDDIFVFWNPATGCYGAMVPTITFSMM